MRILRAIGLVLTLAMTAVACGDDDAGSVESRVLVAEAAEPTALAPLADGGLRYAERVTGRIREVSADGRLRAEPVALVAVVSDGQRGLLGLAVDQFDRTFAAWTRPDGRLVVGQVAGGPDPAPRLIWLGPPSTDLANGGHLRFLDNDRLLIGVGELQAPERVADPTTPHGKVLALDPDGPPDQRPEVRSSSWHNPYAFTVTRDGDVWVADNAPGEDPERLAKNEERPRDLPDKTAPAGLVELPDGRLAVCGYLSGELGSYDVDGSGPLDDGDPVAGPCRLDVARLRDGRIAMADLDAIYVVDLDEG